jgi:hypothetical protein
VPRKHFYWEDDDPTLAKRLDLHREERHGCQECGLSHWDDFQTIIGLLRLRLNDALEELRAAPPVPLSLTDDFLDDVIQDNFMLSRDLQPGAYAMKDAILARAAAPEPPTPKCHHVYQCGRCFEQDNIECRICGEDQ